jgi:UDP-glucose 4-epimerase
MSRVLVTGCAGFIGGNLCRALLAGGHEVVGIDDLSAGTLDNLPGGVEFAELDIRDPGIQRLFAGVDAVFHLAARNCLIDCMRHPIETADVNVKGTIQVLEACRKVGGPKLIYADTSAAYEGIEQFPTPEERVCPIGIYAISKNAGAKFVESYGRLYGQRYTILRYFNVYGPAQDHRRVMAPVMSAFILRLLAGEPPVIYGTGEKRRDFVYVDDVNRFHLQCLRDTRTNGRILNVGSGRNYSVFEIYQAIVEQLGTEQRPVFRPDLPGEAFQTLADLTAARSVGFEPQTDLKDGLARSIEYLKTKVMTKELRA